MSRRSPAPKVTEDQVDRVLLLLVTLRSRAQVRRVCLENEKLKLSADQADAAIAEAATRIALAAAVDFDAELGTAKTRLAELYQKTSTAGDFKTALHIQKEINKLQGLYPGKTDDQVADDDEESPAFEQLARARAHLAPLIDAADTEPLEEIARRVAAIFTAR